MVMRRECGNKERIEDGNEDKCLSMKRMGRLTLRENVGKLRFQKKNEKRMWEQEDHRRLK